MSWNHINGCKKNTFMKNRYSKLLCFCMGGLLPVQTLTAQQAPQYPIGRFGR